MDPNHVVSQDGMATWVYVQELIWVHYMVYETLHASKVSQISAMETKVAGNHVGLIKFMSKILVFRFMSKRDFKRMTRILMHLDIFKIKYMHQPDTLYMM